MVKMVWIQLWVSNIESNIESNHFLAKIKDWIESDRVSERAIFISQIFLSPLRHVHIPWVQMLIHLHFQFRHQPLFGLLRQLQIWFFPAMFLLKSNVVPDKEVIVSSHLHSIFVVFFGAPSGCVGSQPEWILIKLIIIQYLIYLLHVCYQIFLASRIETASKICFNTESADIHLI